MQDFWTRAAVGEPDGCWPWLGSLDHHGYGRFWRPAERRYVGAHRFAYELTHGPIAADLEPDHTCRNRACVNPAHMEPVTHRENVLRGEGLAAENARKTSCPRGHELDGTNVYVNPQGHRRCRECQRAADRRYYAKARDAR
jgi:hypothetical protein